VEEERIVLLRAGDKSLHVADNVGARGHEVLVVRVVSQDGNVLVPAALCRVSAYVPQCTVRCVGSDFRSGFPQLTEEAGDVVNIVDTAVELGLAAKVVDADLWVSYTVAILALTSTALRRPLQREYSK